MYIPVIVRNLQMIYHCHTATLPRRKNNLGSLFKDDDFLRIVRMVYIVLQTTIRMAAGTSYDTVFPASRQSVPDNGADGVIRFFSVLLEDVIAYHAAVFIETEYTDVYSRKLLAPDFHVAGGASRNQLFLERQLDPILLLSDADRFIDVRGVVSVEKAAWQAASAERNTQERRGNDEQKKFSLSV